MGKSSRCDLADCIPTQRFPSKPELEALKRCCCRYRMGCELAKVEAVSLLCCQCDTRSINLRGTRQLSSSSIVRVCVWASQVGPNQVGVDSGEVVGEL